MHSNTVVICPYFYCILYERNDKNGCFSCANLQKTSAYKVETLNPPLSFSLAASLCYNIILLRLATLLRLRNNEYLSYFKLLCMVLWFKSVCMVPILKMYCLKANAVIHLHHLYWIQILENVLLFLLSKRQLCHS